MVVIQEQCLKSEQKEWNGDTSKSHLVIKQIHLNLDLCASTLLLQSDILVMECH